MIRVMIVEDSPVVAALLTQILGTAPGIQVVATAATGERAIKLLPVVNPDVITMDVRLPGMDGFEATRHIMETRPVPIIIVTGSFEQSDVEASFRAMAAGAVAILEKLKLYSHRRS